MSFLSSGIPRITKRLQLKLTRLRTLEVRLIDAIDIAEADWLSAYVQLANRFLEAIGCLSELESLELQLESHDERIRFEPLAALPRLRSWLLSSR